ncbi:MAG: nucleotide exchange factor GrpE [Thermoanaerobaculales bacterium]|jgi:molecular chaperone GrpE|nr:nucleotide exchange factor GrpE [Thermoanaerobaculales bacterium]
MVDSKDTPLDLNQDDLDDIEIEFVDEGGGESEADAQPQPEPEEKGLEPVDLGPSVEIEIERLEGELDELRDIHLRKLAEFDNFRKRTERERVEIKKFASEELVRELLPVLDNFERALEHGSESDPGAFHEGVEMIARQLWDALERQGVEVVNPEGERFSPEFHEAVHRVEDESLEPGTVASVLAKGYVYNGRLVRPAMVGVVADAPKPPENGSGEEPAGAGGADE